MGAENLTPGATFKWADAFWDDAYNNAAQKFSAIEPERKLVRIDSEDSTVSELIIVKSKKRLLKRSKKIKKRD